MTGSWPPQRLRKAVQLVVDELEKQGVMTRMALRERVKGTIKGTGLLDSVLNSIGGHIVGNRVVRRTKNPDTRLFEFSLDHLPGGAALDDAVATPSVESPSAVQRDILWVYNHVLLRVQPRAAEAVLHSKRWAKEWELQDHEDDHLRFLCRWIPHDIEPTRPEQPSELLVLLTMATVADLKKEAEKAFRDTYCGMEGYRVATMEGVPGEEAELLFLCEAAQKGVAQVCVRGDGADLAGEPVCEGGRESLTVKCSCGTTDDDGERMVACNVCDVRQHTRCAAIADGDAVPPMFLCTSCNLVVTKFFSNY